MKGARKKNRINTTGTMEYLQRTKENKRKERMRTTLQSTKESRQNTNTYHLVVLPDKSDYYVENMDDPNELEEIYDWMAENTVDFLNEIQLLYTTMSEGNGDWLDLCARFSVNKSIGYPPETTYRWKVTKDSPAEVVAVNIYVDHIFAWCDALIQNEDIFPSDEDTPFPKNFVKHLKKMYSRLLRVFYIVHSNECLVSRMGNDDSLKLCMKHFLYFAWKWGLLKEEDGTEMPLKIKAIRKRYRKDRRAYLDKKLPYMGDKGEE